MGIVYEALDRDRRQVVALKTLLQFDPAALYLFKQEFRTLADVHHANLVRLYELEMTGAGEVFFTMELLRGTDFLTYVRKADERAPSSPAPTIVQGTAARVTARPPSTQAASAQAVRARSGAHSEHLFAALPQLVEGVHALHTAGKLHRDIKPSNIMVTGEGRVVLLDFGVATELSRRGESALAGSGDVVGTARYMAPEQSDAGPPSPASDWYSVGVVLYEALCGRPPFSGSFADVLSMKSVLDPPPPSECVTGVPPELDALCRELLHRDPAMRPTGVEILQRLGATRSSFPPVLRDIDTAAAFVGREAQLVALRAAFDATRGGRAVTVRVAGPSGMGKSTLVHCFLEELASNGGAVVLWGRAYERETVPYKAVDSVVDALSRHLIRLTEADQPLPLPADTWALARLFPVLQSVPGLGELVARPGGDLQDIRRRAFAALRELVASLIERKPLVVFVDDAQWGDVDSALLLREVLRPPEAPPLLLVMTYRDNEAAASPFLVAMGERWPEQAETRDVEVGPLAAEDAFSLSRTLMTATGDLAERMARLIARESHGSPFLIEELARSNLGAAAANDASLVVATLGQMVGQRLERLPDEARRLVELVAVGGRPLPVPIVGEASEIGGALGDVVSMLSARRFTRTGLRDGRDVIEMTHDRFRQTIVAQLPAATLREHHGRLARALENASGADAEALALHWLGAGDEGRAARHAARAADHAVSKLAFEQAVRLFRFAIEHTPAGTPSSELDVRSLHARLAEALQFAGRYEESARAYIVAAEGAPADQRIEYQRAAAEQLLSAGRMDEGREMLHRVLAAIGMSAPRSPLVAVIWLLFYRLWLAVLGLGIVERDAEAVRREDRVRVDALFTVAMGFSIVDVILGACMQTRHLIEALRKGDRFQLLRATSLQAGHLAATGEPEGKSERVLVEVARGLAERDGRPEALVYSNGARGIGLWNRGHWAESRDLLERALEVPLYGFAGVSSVRLFAVYAYYYLGAFRECRDRHDRFCAEAADRGDLYTTVNLRTGASQWIAMVADEPERGKREMSEALAQWSQAGFSLQHWQFMVWGAEVDLYIGDAPAAYDRLVNGQPAFDRSFLLHAGFVRATTLYMRAKAAIASIPSFPERKRERIAEARRIARKLSREFDPWTGVLASLLHAMAENASGNRSAAMAALGDAIARAEATGTQLFASPARHRLGELVGGAEGRLQMSDSVETLLAEGVKNPQRWIACQLPGTWRSAPEGA
jgi:tetratricopeptide (TPR) repeat protein